MSDRIIVIGAGIGGLSAAIYLSAAGYEVLVLEKNPTVGGKMSQVEEAGYRWDTGPSVITMRHVFEDLFATAGRRLEDYLTLERVDPLTRYFYPDGTILDASLDPEKMARQIEAIDPGDVDGYARFLKYISRLHDLVGPLFIYDHPPKLSRLLKVSPFEALRFDGLRTMHQAISSYVQSPQLRQLLGRFATYVGASPYQAPATLNVIAHVELNGGVWYPEGGIYQIAEAYARLACELGVTIQTCCTVAEIVTSGGRVEGVRLEDGALITARAVIANVDVAAVYERLLPGTAPVEATLRRLQQIEPSGSGFVLLLGIDKYHPELAQHNIFFSGDYRREFRQIFNEGTLPDDPTIYVAITSKRTPSDAPDGHENWFVLVNTPALNDKVDWQEQTAPYRDLVLARLANFGFDVREHIRAERILTPVDIQSMTTARCGALYGASSNNRWAAFKRPHNRSRLFDRLYFAGGTTHPGGGVPMVTLSGKVASELAMEDLSQS